jgi:ATP-dependent helicase HrpB
MMGETPALPIHEISDQIVSQLTTHGALVLSAPTGSGKTTQVPQILLHSGLGDCGLGDSNLAGSDLADKGQILVLQPRRLAARLVATRVAAELGEPLGQTVGYQTRHEGSHSPETRILFLTEGLFLRRLMSEPQLPGVAAVILDEFHERSLASDLTLGLCRRLRATERPDLRLVVMSATLDMQTIGTWLACPCLSAQGRMYPVDIDYAAGASDAPVWERAAAALRQWLDGGGQGDVLVFMSGTYEIRRSVEAIRARLTPNDGTVDVLPLYGGLRPAQQDQAVAPGDHRKVIVSTNVAQTSITIDGIVCVIDAGLARVARYDPARGVNALLVENISLASADQRAGRAGRTAPGSCLRLWPRAEAHARAAHDTPEVQRVDLAEAVLQLAALGVRDATEFAWLDPPPAERLAQAVTVLQSLDALDTHGRLTPRGRDMSRLSAHPRLARLLCEAAHRGVGERAAIWAALISERDICQRPLAPRYRQPPEHGWPSDLLVRETALEAARSARFDPRRCSELGLHAGTCREVDRASRQLERQIRSLDPNPGSKSRDRRPRPSSGKADEQLARCLLIAYADHIARRRGTDSRACEMDGRRRVLLDRDSAIGDAPLLVAVDLREVEASRADGGGVHTVASLATAIQPQWITETLPDRVTTDQELGWDEQERAVYVTEGQRLGGLWLQPRRRRADDGTAAAQLIIDRVLAGELQFERWDAAVDAWLSRARCVAEWFPERGLVSYDDEDLGVVFAEIVGRASRWGAVRQAPVLDHVRQAMSWADQQFVEKMAPERLKLPTGFGMQIHYTPGEPPRGRAKIQDLYDVTRTPTVGGGRIKLLLEILAPNFRPAQVTDDLPGFWERTYPEVKKELKRRYPKHEWR